MKNHLQRVSLIIIGFLLVGFMIGGRGFSHLGAHPFYISEAVLAICLILFLCSQNLFAVKNSPAILYIIPMNIWCLAQTIYYFDEYGIDSLQDSALYGYSVFAFIITSALSDRSFFQHSVIYYDKIATYCTIAMPLLLFISPNEMVHSDQLPLIFLKSGDVAVHLAGILVFRMVKLHDAVTPPSGRDKIITALFWTSWIISALWVSSIARAGLLSMLAAILICVSLGFARKQVLSFVLALSVILGTMHLFSVRIEQDRRDISVEQLVENFTSILDGEEASSSELESTARWRLRWWEEIIDYTLFGDDFWTGRGFGINLANTDRFQADPDKNLRSPHSVHMTFLARTGVPGLLMWLAFLANFALLIIRNAQRTKRIGAANMQRLFVWVLAYWTAALVNASFDVYLEGPQGGIWFWAITGFGAAAMLPSIQGKDAKATP